MASSKLLKEAIADAKAVRETAIANAKIALEEAFTPRLQSILSKKLQAEMEGDEEEADINEDNDTSSEIGSGADNKMPTDKVNSAQTDLSGISKQSGEPGSEGEETKVKDDEILDMYTRAGEVYQNVIKTPKQVGYYRIGKSFNIFFEKKPCGLHRFFTKVLLGWNWFDQK